MTRLASRQATAGPSGTWGDTGRPEAEPGALQEQTQALGSDPMLLPEHWFHFI